MDKNQPHYYEFFDDLLMEGDGCVMVGLTSFPEFAEFVNKIPKEIVYRYGDSDYGIEHHPHITVLYGIEDSDDDKAKDLLATIPGKVAATLGKITLFEGCDGGKFDVLKIDVDSPDLTRINGMLTRNVKYSNTYKKYHPHVTLAYLKPGKGKEYVGNSTFEGKKFLFETFTYSAGSKDTKTHDKIIMKEYLVGTGGGYGGAAGGSIAAAGWAGTPSSPQTSRRLKDYKPTNGGSYMQGNTVINTSLYDTITNDDLTDEKFSPDDIFSGLRYEMGRMEYPDKDHARGEVMRNLAKDPHFYADLKQYFDSDKL